MNSPIDQYFKEIIFQGALDRGSDVIELEVMPDHVHLLMEVGPQYGINSVIKKMKRQSSKILREKYGKLKSLPALWTNSYFVSTVGGAPLHIIKQYIENQKYV